MGNRALTALWCPTTAAFVRPCTSQSAPTSGYDTCRSGIYSAING